MTSKHHRYVAPKALACVEQFDQIHRKTFDMNSHTHQIVDDQLCRFRIWSGNIGALQNSSLAISLGHRLREAPKVVAQVVKILEQLSEKLQKSHSHQYKCFIELMGYSPAYRLWRPAK